MLNYIMIIVKNKMFCDFIKGFPKINDLFLFIHRKINSKINH